MHSIIQNKWHKNRKPYQSVMQRKVSFSNGGISGIIGRNDLEEKHARYIFYHAKKMTELVFLLKYS